MQNLLAEMKCVKEIKIKKNIAEIVISIIKRMISDKQFKFFIKNNAAENDTVIQAILAYLCLYLKDSDFRCVRCLSHIINFIAKAFLFDQDADIFKEES